MSHVPPALTAALDDRYRIERELGQGGMATVYLADDVRHRRKVAVKVLRPELAAAPTSRPTPGGWARCSARSPRTGRRDTMVTNPCPWRVTMVVRRAALAAVLFYLLAGRLPAQEAVVTPLMARELTDLPGKEGVMLTVEYGPGQSSAAHRHNAHTFVYVLEGSVEMQVKGAQLVTLTPGQTFYEGPDDIHVVSRNASATRPARLLVLFVKNKGAPGSVPAR